MRNGSISGEDDTIRNVPNPNFECTILRMLCGKFHAFSTMCTIFHDMAWLIVNDYLKGSNFRGN